MFSIKEAMEIFDFPEEPENPHVDIADNLFLVEPTFTSYKNFFDRRKKPSEQKVNRYFKKRWRSKCPPETFFEVTQGNKKSVWCDSKTNQAFCLYNGIIEQNNFTGWKCIFRHIASQEAKKIKFIIPIETENLNYYFEDVDQEGLIILSLYDNEIFLTVNQKSKSVPINLLKKLKQSEKEIIQIAFISFPSKQWAPHSSPDAPLNPFLYKKLLDYINFIKTFDPVDWALEEQNDSLNFIDQETNEDIKGSLERYSFRRENFLFMFGCSFQKRSQEASLLMINEMNAWEEAQKLFFLQAFLKNIDLIEETNMTLCFNEDLHLLNKI